MHSSTINLPVFSKKLSHRISKEESVLSSGKITLLVCFLTVTSSPHYFRYIAKYIPTYLNILLEKLAHVFVMQSVGF